MRTIFLVTFTFEASDIGEAILHLKRAAGTAAIKSFGLGEPRDGIP